MHMAPRAAAWVAWAEWTCNTPQRVFGQKRAGFEPDSGLADQIDLRGLSFWLCHQIVLVTAAKPWEAGGRLGRGLSSRRSMLPVPQPRRHWRAAAKSSHKNGRRRMENREF